MPRSTRTTGWSTRTPVNHHRSDDATRDGQDNFDKAVAGAITETRRQWQDYRAALSVGYGEADAALMTCALSHDDPVTECNDPGPNRLVVTASVVVVVILLLLGMIYYWRRRRRSTA